MIDRPTLYLRICPWEQLPATIREDYPDKPVFLYDNPSDLPELLETLQDWKCAVYSGNCFTRKQRADILKHIPPYTEIVADIVWLPCINEYLTDATILQRLSRFQMPYYDEGIHTIRVRHNMTEEAQNRFKTTCLLNMEIPHDNSHHRYNIREHCNLTAHYVAEKGNFVDYSWTMLEAAEYHDVGKPWTRTFTDKKGTISEEAHYYNHQNIGAWIACGITPTDPLLPWLISTHMDPTLNTKYYRNLPPYLKTLVDTLHEADRKAH
ncbi:MAG: hypothetical protein J6S14_15230 [Clostridia bacterium]|nr:hypothetical protein [Clostridia bacterium]